MKWIKIFTRQTIAYLRKPMRYDSNDFVQNASRHLKAMQDEKPVDYMRKELKRNAN